MVHISIIESESIGEPTRKIIVRDIRFLSGTAKFECKIQANGRRNNTAKQSH